MKKTGITIAAMPVFSIAIDSGKQYNFRMCDALPYAKDGTLSEKLDELFGEYTVDSLFCP